MSAISRYAGAWTLALAAAAGAASNVDPDAAKAWGENIGWINAQGDIDHGVSIGWNVLSGYAWCENVGWLNLGDGSPQTPPYYSNSSAADFGVNNDGAGNLSGYAWGENIGWVDFDTSDVGGSRVVLASNGQLSGYAWSENVGWIAMNSGYGVKAAPSVEVISANGGENWLRGGPHTITWRSMGLTGNACIYLYDNWTKLCVLATVPIANGSWSWTIPATELPKVSYRVRVQSTKVTSVSDYSDDKFTISALESVTVGAPNGGEAWMPGTAHAITWTSSHLSGNARIYLYTDYTKLRILATVPILDGTWSWGVPADEPTGSAYRIRLQSLADTTINDYSNELFAIGATPALDVASPNGGETWHWASTHAITWDATNVSGDVRIFLYNNWSKVRVLGDAAASAGSVNWDISQGETVRATYRIRVQSLKHTTLNDYSDGMFSIAP